jgi:DNA-binding transcriptional regulator GbsR (MarR family)
VKTLDFIKGKVSLSEDRIRRFKFASKLCLQCSNIFYSCGQKKKSLKFASEAYKNSCKALQETFEICKKYQMNIQSKPKSTKLSKSEKNKLLLIERALPTLETVHGFLVNGSIHKVGMRSALGVKGDPDWVAMFNLNELMTLVPVKSSDFTQGMGIQAEFTKDYLFYKIGLLALSMHVLGLRHASLGSKDLAQKFCISASKLLKNFFSENSPIVQEIQSFSCFEASENSPAKQKRIRRNKSLSFNLAKINVHSSSFTKFRSIYEKNNFDTHKSSPKKKVKRNVSFTSNVFREMKKRSASSELKLNVE